MIFLENKRQQHFFKKRVIMFIKDNTFIRKKVMLVSRSTVDFRSWSLSELLAGKLSWWIRKTGITTIGVTGKNLEQLGKSPLSCYLEGLEMFICYLSSACEEVSDEYRFKRNRNTSDNTPVFVIWMIKNIVIFPKH